MPGAAADPCRVPDPAAVLWAAVQRAVPAGGPPLRLYTAGICKNAGKTTALNALVTVAGGAGQTVALASTGVDGEERDAVTNLPKPRIRVPAGAWVATAAGALTGACGVDICQELPLTTPLGPMVIGRAGRSGHVVLTGPGSRRRVATVLAALTALAQPDVVLLDGSLNRQAAAAPDVTDALVLAVGAAYSPDLGLLQRHVAGWLDRLQLPAVDVALRRRVQAAWTHQRIAWLRGNDVILAPVAAALGDAATGAAGLDGAATASAPPSGGTAAVMRWLADLVSRPGASEHEGEGAPPLVVLAVAGSVADGLLTALSRQPAWLQRLELVVPDYTHVVAEPETWAQFRRCGGRIRVLWPVHPAAIVCNPYSPVGAGLDPGALVAAMAAVAPRLPVLDLVAGLARLPDRPDGPDGPVGP